LRKGQARSSAADTTGGRTLSFEVADGHPQEKEVLELLSRLRRETDELWEKVNATNSEKPLGEDQVKRVVFYFGQFVKDDQDEG
jgi:hypothetical protein